MFGKVYIRDILNNHKMSIRKISFIFLKHIAKLMIFWNTRIYDIEKEKKGAFYMQNTKVYAYCRVSHNDQNVSRQVTAVKAYALEHELVLDERDIIIDKASGKDFCRDGWRLLKEHLLRPQDILIIKELDRLSRDYNGIKEEWHNLCFMNINIVIIDTPILNTLEKSDLEKTLISNIVFELLAYMAEAERKKIRQRQAEGIANAKANGKKLGRPKIIIPDNFDSVIDKWKQGDITAKTAMSLLRLKRTSFYRLVKKLSQ